MNEKNLSSISDSEWEVMRIIWTLGETNTKQILNELRQCVFDGIINIEKK